MVLVNFGGSGGFGEGWGIGVMANEYKLDTPSLSEKYFFIKSGYAIVISFSL
jgi:hypothetical protein